MNALRQSHIITLGITTTLLVASLVLEWMSIDLGTAVLGPGLVLISVGLVSYSLYSEITTRRAISRMMNRLETLQEKYLTGTVVGGVADIATSIENGLENLAVSIDSDNDQRTQGGGLIHTRLQSLKEKIRLANEKDQKVYWANEGHTQISEILRANNENLENACFKLISFLTKYLKAQVGAIYLSETSENDVLLELKGCYAFEKKRIIEQKFTVDENLVGQCFLEKEMLVLREVPENYLKITSGLGGSKPDNLVLVPLLYNEEIHGVLEIASFAEFKPHEMEFLKKSGEIISSSVLQLRNNQRTTELLQISQNQAEEMRASEEELRQNMEELEATQEQMHRQVKELTDLKKDLEKERYLFDALMNYLPDAIYYKDKDSKLIRVSKYMSDAFGIPAAELLGKSDFDFQDKEHASKAFEDERTIMRTKRPLIDIIEKETRSDGSEVWVSTTKLPLMNTAGEVVGTFGVSRNITKLKNLEKEVQAREQRMKTEITRYEERIRELEGKVAKA